MMPTTHELVQFCEIFRTRHVSNSAIRLGVTQPALTQALKKLESKAGGALFNRTPQGMVPTRLGITLYKYAGELNDSWSKIQTELRAVQVSLAGRFRVGCHPSVASYCIPQVLRELDQSAPGIELELIHDYSRKVLEQVVNFDLDLAFVVNPVRHPELVLKALGTDTVHFWIRKGLQTPPNRLLTDLSLPQTADLLGKSKHFMGWSILQSANLEVIRTLTLQGLGVGCLPERVALVDDQPLCPYRSNELPALNDRIFLAYRKDAMTGEASRALLHACSRALPETR